MFGGITRRGLPHLSEVPKATETDPKARYRGLDSV